MQLCWGLIYIVVIELCRCMVNAYIIGGKSYFSSRCLHRRKILSLSFPALRSRLRLYNHSPSNERVPTSILPVIRTSGVPAMRHLRESYSAGDPLSFQTTFLELDENIRSNVERHLTMEEKEELLSMIRLFAKQFKVMAVVRILRAMERLGFSVHNAREKPVLSELVKVCVEHKTASLIGHVLFFTAIRKLGFTWEDILDKDDVLIFLENALSVPQLTRRQFEELIIAVARLGIPWTALSNKCQEKILEKLPDMKNEVDLRIIVPVLYAFSSVKDLNIKELSATISLTFLQIVEDCLKSTNLIKEESVKARQVSLDILFQFNLHQYISFC
jgi:hypothetical protein